MKTMSAIIKSTGCMFDTIARARVQSALLAMGRVWVEQHGYSWEMLRVGVSEWPWHQGTEAATTEQENGHAIADLNRCSDRELHDLRIHRGDIGNALRDGRAGIDFGQDPEKSAA